MTKAALKRRTDIAVMETRKALQSVYNCLNNGQRMQIVKVEEVRALFDRYDVEYKI